MERTAAPRVITVATKITAREADALAHLCARRGITRSSMLHELLADFLRREAPTVDIDLAAEEADRPRRPERRR